MHTQNNADRILYLLKTRGPLSAAELGKSLDITSMGARQHLQSLEQQQLVCWQDTPSGRGRPRRSWHLTETALRRFPDTHSELTLTLIDSVTELFGDEGLEKLIQRREQQLLRQYSQALTEADSIGERLQILASLRTAEGYMAEWQQLESGDYLLLEHHCPICAAATRCQGFCRSELALLQQVMGDGVSVSREQYLLSGDLRCSYRISPKQG